LKTHSGPSGLFAVLSDVLSGVILKQIIYTDNSAAGGREQWVATLNHGDTILSGADSLRYRSSQDFRTISQYRLIDLSPTM